MVAVVLLLLFGLLCILLGANALVDGASAVARRLGVSEFVIGLTIVGFGTSCPELVVSMKGAFAGNADIAVGNVTGSNIFNALFILGSIALLRPIAITEVNRRKDIPLTLAATLLLLLCGPGASLVGLCPGCGGISRWEGGAFLVLFAGYVALCFRGGKSRGAPVEAQGEGASALSTRPLGWAVAVTVLGLAGLVVGGHFFVDNAIHLARRVGVSDKFIAVTLLAGGTSLPECAASMVAAVKGKQQLALGNILGTNVFNLLLILGCGALVTPLSCASMTHVDALALLLGAATPLLWAYTGREGQIDRWQGGAMLLGYVGYFLSLFVAL